MKFTLRTNVAQSLENVKEGFNEDLFSQLAPPFPKVNIKQFDGSKKGDIVSLELNFIIFRQNWTSKIVDEGSSDTEYFFIDEGTILPFGITFWRHKHTLQSINEKTQIIDEVEFRSWNGLASLLLFPILLSQFFYRKPIYKRIFGQN
ncbi:MAG: hypothetical protein HWE21_17835 [Cytophagia bacterium]|nr:hypothetical protein [Cytophagia bacterium]